MERRTREKRNTRVRKKTREYFERCDQLGRRYTLSGLKTALGSDAKDFDRLRGDPRLGPDLELAVLKIMDELEQRGDSMALLLRRELGSARRADTAGADRVVFGEEDEGREYGR